MEKIKKILVTGSSGAVGIRLCEVLIEKGFDVTGIDLRKNPWSEKVNKVTKLIDLTKPKQIQTLSNDFDLIIHLAAYPYVFPSVENPNLAHANYDMTFNILEFARKNGIKRIMFSSSREAYGNINKKIISEEDAHIRNAESPYSASKLASEAMITAYSRCYDMSHIIFRFSNVYGMYDLSHRVMPLFMRNAKKGDTLEVYGKDKVLDFTHVDDLMKGIVACISKYEAAKNNTINLSGNHPVKILDLASKIKENLKSESNIDLQESRTGEVTYYVANLSKAKKLLGFEPSIKIDEGLKMTTAWFKSVEDFNDPEHPNANLHYYKQTSELMNEEEFTNESQDLSSNNQTNSSEELNAKKGIYYYQN